ncbi:hypothetical protein J4227_01065 [Candidatus Woesearchaeota archaeon]|nr:hypothetical protein [Candidatus Woesearchaeota archaeon]
MEDYGRIRGIKRGHPKMKEIDNTTKIIAIIVIAIVVYLLSFLVLRNIFAGDLNTIQHMAAMRGGSANYYHTLITTSSLLIAAVVALIASLLLKSQKTAEQGKPGKADKSNELKIIKKALSADEKKIVEEVEKAREITQDSLKFRLDWSKAKVSTILTNLDRKGILQRERLGKTYTIKLQK